MRRKNQDSQPLSTEEKLEFFIERADVLSRYISENFSNNGIRKFSVTRNTNIDGDEWKFHTLIYGLICLIRLFFLPKDSIALYPIPEYKPSKRDTYRKLQPTDVPLRKLSDEPSWYKAVDQAIEAINQLFYGIGTPPDAELQNLPYIYNGNPITRLEEFSTIIYGEIVHYDIEKRRIYKLWKKAPGDLFSNLLTDFIVTAFHISLEIIPPVAEASKQELHRLTSNLKSQPPGPQEQNP